MSDQSAIESFVAAVHARDAVALRQVLTEHDEVRAAINDPLFGFDSPALVAVSGDNDLALVDTLLEFGADPNRRSSWWAGGFHPLYAARGAIAERLLAAGAVPDACAAAHLDRLDLLESMLQRDPSRVHERGGDGQTPLHFARSREVVDLLLNHGADIDARDVDHRSTAAEWMIGDPERAGLARYLVERGASADIFLASASGKTERVTTLLEDDPGRVMLRTAQGEYAEQGRSSYHIYMWTLGPNLSPLQVAARFGHRETVEVIRRFAPVTEQLLLACHEGDRPTALELVRANPDVVGQMNDHQKRALTEAAWSANAPAVELLLELGFDPAMPMTSGPVGATALHCAAWEGSAECVSALLRYPAGRALLNAREPQWNGTPLSWCCHGSRNCGSTRADHGNVARLLIAAGASVDRSMLDWGCADAVQAAIVTAVERADAPVDPP